ncbi:MAG: DNA mismatch repair protein MutS, partial [Spirochaetales bacterium]
PGTVLQEEFLDKTANNFLAAVGVYKKSLSFSYVDSSTGDFFSTSYPYKERVQALKTEFQRLLPREIIIQDSLLSEDADIARFIDQQDSLLVNRFPDWSFDIKQSAERLKRHFGMVNLKAFGLSDESPELFTAGTLLDYLEDSVRSLLLHIRSITVYSKNDFLSLDEAAQKNLEIVSNLQDGSARFTLLETLDHTKTSMGARKLKQWLLSPLKEKLKIESRHENVETLYRNQGFLREMRGLLARILDIERLTARLAMNKAHARDLLGIKDSLAAFFRIKERLNAAEDLSSGPATGAAAGRAARLWTVTEEGTASLKETYALLDVSICEDPSILLNEGRLIKKGYSGELDRINLLKSDSQHLLNQYLKTEKERSGISTLKIRFNRIIGYFLEVTKSNLHLVPSHFIRRQSLLNAERFSTENLVELESELNSAAEKIITLERDLFLEVREKVKSCIPHLKEAARNSAELDCFASFAYAATVHGYTRPVMTETGELSIFEGRHPVVENHLPPGEFVPNNLELKPDGTFFALLTGPNMAGKSTFLRQTALSVLMAQAGSFIPAREAVIGITDKIFCRVGASDNLARGESTFLVEMSETAHILRTATEKSLIIMDEIGRGTSSQDGLSVAGAVMHYILDRIRAKTLFATHFHELTDTRHRSLLNLSMAVVEKADDVIFLKKVKEGPSANSYGIHVARLAGLPEEVILQAGKTLYQVAPAGIPEKQGRRQEELFSIDDVILRELKELSIDNLTPLEALNQLYKWKKCIDSSEAEI